MIRNEFTTKVVTTYAPQLEERVTIMTESKNVHLSAAYQRDRLVYVRNHWGEKVFIANNKDCRELAQFFTELADILDNI
jgi:hypothetical protein